ncbi:unnamed protein product [Gadus morhua 'NCC']
MVQTHRSHSGGGASSQPPLDGGRSAEPIGRAPRRRGVGTAEGFLSAGGARGFPPGAAASSGGTGAAGATRPGGPGRPPSQQGGASRLGLKGRSGGQPCGVGGDERLTPRLLKTPERPAGQESDIPVQKGHIQLVYIQNGPTAGPHEACLPRDPLLSGSRAARLAVPLQRPACVSGGTGGEGESPGVMGEEGEGGETLQDCERSQQRELRILSVYGKGEGHWRWTAMAPSSSLSNGGLNYRCLQTTAMPERERARSCPPTQRGRALEPRRAAGPPEEPDRAIEAAARTDPVLSRLERRLDPPDGVRRPTGSQREEPGLMAPGP